MLQVNRIKGCDINKYWGKWKWRKVLGLVLYFLSSKSNSCGVACRCPSLYYSFDILLIILLGIYQFYLCFYAGLLLKLIGLSFWRGESFCTFSSGRDDFDFSLAGWAKSDFHALYYSCIYFLLGLALAEIRASSSGALLTFSSSMLALISICWFFSKEVWELISQTSPSILHLGWKISFMWLTIRFDGISFSF